MRSINNIYNYIYPPPRLARTAFLIFRRQASSLHSTYLPTCTSLPSVPSYLLRDLKSACRLGPPHAPRPSLKSSKNLLNSSENLLKPFKTHSKPPQTSQNLLKTTKTLGKRSRGPSRSSPGRLPDPQKAFKMSGFFDITLNLREPFKILRFILFLQ